jgi:hypothetical protein
MTEVKNTGNISGTFKFVREVYFSPPSLFFCYKTIGLFNFLKNTFWHQILFSSFSIFFSWEERGELSDSGEEREFFVGDDSDHQTG